MIGWWLEGPKPGDTQGTALLTGHTVHYGGGAFDHLASLVVGDHFRIRTVKGVITYLVSGVRKYTTGALSRSATSLFRLTGLPKVLLITCANWNGHIYVDKHRSDGGPGVAGRCLGPVFRMLGCVGGGGRGLRNHGGEHRSRRGCCSQDCAPAP